MSLRDDLNTAMKDAMRAKDARRLTTVRMMLAAIKDKDISSRTDGSREGVSDDELLQVFAKMIKQREESAAVYDQGNRPELAAAEREEVAVIRGFMPQQMDEAAIKAACEKAVAETGAQGPKDMGKVMAALKGAYAGQMDFAKAGAVVKGLLAGG